MKQRYLTYVLLLFLTAAAQSFGAKAYSPEAGGPDVWINNQTTFPIRVSTIRSAKDGGTLFRQITNYPAGMDPISPGSTAHFQRAKDQYIGGKNRTPITLENSTWEDVIYAHIGPDDDGRIEEYRPNYEKDRNSSETTPVIIVRSQWGGTGWRIRLTERKESTGWKPAQPSGSTNTTNNSNQQTNSQNTSDADYGEYDWNF